MSKQYDARIFVDGSYRPSTGEYAYGMVIYDNDHPDGAYYKQSYQPDALSPMNNVAGELSGAMAAFRYIKDHQCKNVELNYDYQGLRAWCDGSWRAKNSYTQMYRAEYEEVAKQCQIDFNHTPGHTGVEGNELCDQLAKDVLEIKISQDPKIREARSYGAVSHEARLAAALETPVRDDTPKLEPRKEAKEDTSYEDFIKDLITEKYGVSIAGGDLEHYTVHYCGVGYEENNGDAIKKYADARKAYVAWGTDRDGLNGDSWVVFDSAANVPAVYRDVCTKAQQKTDAERASVNKAMNVGNQFLEADTQHEDDVELPWN